MSPMPDTIQEKVRMPVGTPSAASGGLTAGDFLRILRQRLLMILFLWFLLIGLTVGGTFLWIKYYPGYRAIGYIQIVSIDPKRLLESAGPLRVDLMDRLLEDQAVMLKSVEVLRETLLDADVRATDWYTAFADDVNEAHLGLEDDLGCTPMRGTSYVQVQMTCRQRQDPHRIINVVLTRYNRIAGEQFTSRYRQELNEWGIRVTRLETDLNGLRDRRLRFQAEEINAAGAVWGNNAITQQYQLLAQQVTLAQEEERFARAQYLLYADRAPTDIAVPPDMQQMIEQDPTVGGLSQRLLGLDEELKVAAQNGLLPNNKYYKSIQARVQTVKTRLNQKRSEMLSDLQKYLTEQAEINWRNAQITLTDLQEQYEYAKAAQRDLDAKLMTYMNMEEEEKRLQTDYADAAKYLQDLDLSIKAKQTFQLETIPAVEPKQRSSPRWGMNIFVGTAMGLLAAVGLAVLLEFADTSVRTGRDLIRHVHVPLLGVIPDLDDEEVAIDDIMMAVRSAPNSMVAEAFRAMRTHLERSGPVEHQRTLLVTSPRPDDGKTAVSVNLAVAVASNHRRVLLVDTNFRKPALHQVFKLSADRGLSDILRGQGTLSSLAAPSGVERLDVLCCGRIPSNPVEQLGSPAMQTLIDEAMGTYDQVILDGPPLLLVSDALVIAGLVDGVMLVTRAKANSRGVVVRARERLDNVGARIIGAALNAAQVRRGGYFREQYREFYDYQTAEAGSAGSGPVPHTPQPEDDDQPEPS